MDRLGGEKIFCHAERLLDIKARGDAYPVHLTIGLTDYCCHRCVFCNSEFATADISLVNTIDSKVLLRFLGEAKDAGLKAVTIVGAGEPLLHPDTANILRGIHALGLDIGIFTNASRLNEEIREAVLDTCTFLRCSVNASNAAEHEMVHRVKGDFDNVVGNIRALVEGKKKRGTPLPTIGTQFVFYDKNYMSIYNAAKLWKDVGVDYFEVKPVIEGEGSSVNISVFPAKDTKAVEKQMLMAEGLADDTYTVYMKRAQYAKTLGKKNYRKYAVCYGHMIDMNMWSNGDVFICPNHEHPEDVIGNIYESSFLDIWNGEKRRRRIEKIHVAQCPRGCRCDPINEKIWDFLHPDPLMHPNFV